MKFTEFLKLASRPRKRKNKELLLAVAKKLRGLKHEEHYDQTEVVERTACGTTACIAGHAVLVAGCPVAAAYGTLYDKGENGGVLASAQNLLGLNDVEAGLLFSGSPYISWPEPYSYRYRDAQQGLSDERPSRVAADLLEAIANGKVKL